MKVKSSLKSRFSTISRAKLHPNQKRSSSQIRSKGLFSHYWIGALLSLPLIKLISLLKDIGLNLSSASRKKIYQNEVRIQSGRKKAQELRRKIDQTSSTGDLQKVRRELQQIQADIDARIAENTTLIKKYLQEEEKKSNINLYNYIKNTHKLANRDLQILVRYLGLDRSILKELQEAKQLILTDNIKLNSNFRKYLMDEIMVKFQQDFNEQAMFQKRSYARRYDQTDLSISYYAAKHGGLIFSNDKDVYSVFNEQIFKVLDNLGTKNPSPYLIHEDNPIKQIFPYMQLYSVRQVNLEGNSSKSEERLSANQIHKIKKDASNDLWDYQNKGGTFVILDTNVIVRYPCIIKLIKEEYPSLKLVFFKGVIQELKYLYSNTNKKNRCETIRRIIGERVIFTQVLQRFAPDQNFAEIIEKTQKLRKKWNTRESIDILNDLTSLSVCLYVELSRRQISPSKNTYLQILKDQATYKISEPLFEKYLNNLCGKLNIKVRK